MLNAENEHLLIIGSENIICILITYSVPLGIPDCDYISQPRLSESRYDGRENPAGTHEHTIPSPAPPSEMLCHSEAAASSSGTSTRGEAAVCWVILPSL